MYRSFYLLTTDGWLMARKTNETGLGWAVADPQKMLKLLLTLLAPPCGSNVVECINWGNKQQGKV